MVRRLFFSVGVLGLVLALAFQPSVAQDNSQLFDGMNIVFAVDVSGSMYQNVNATNPYDKVDKGLRYVLDKLGDRNLEIEATDAENLRFETINFIVQWLQSFAITQENRDRQLDVNVRMVTFDQSATLQTDWVNLNAASDPNHTGTTFTYRPPTGISSTPTSDFLNLYDTLRGMGTPPSDNHKNMLVIITDSLPCSPPDIGFPEVVNGTSVREVSCANYTQMEGHINNLNAQSLSNYDQYLYIIPPMDDPSRFDQVQEIYARFDDEWENQIKQQPHYLTLDALPSDLFKAIVLEIGTVLGIGNADPDQVFAELGLNPINQSFEVPPYLTSMEMLIFLPNGDTAGLPTFQQGSDEINYTVVDTKANGILNWIRFINPRPGQWEIKTSAGSFDTWATFLPGQGSLSFASNAGSVYSPFEIHYQVLDTEGNPLLIQEDYPLDFDIQLIGTGGAFPITDFSASGTTYIARFATLTAGSFTLSGNVRPTDSTWAENANIDASFLNPTNTDNIDIKGADWTPTFGSSDQQAAIQNGILSISRRDDVLVDLQLLQGTTPLPIPDNATASLIFEAPPEAQDACPTSGDITLSPAQNTRLTSTVRFPEGGICIVYLEITLADDEFLPLERETVIYPQNEIGRVDVSTTSRVQVVIPNGNQAEIAPENNPTSLSLKMEDYVGDPQIWKNGSLLSWERDETTIRLLIKDEKGNPVDPEYVGFENVTVSEAETSIEGQETGAATEENTSAVILPDAPIPFQVRITQSNSDKNLATEKNIKVLKSAQVGYYLLNIRDLDPGDYLVEIILNTEQPALRSDFEYDPTILQGVRPGAQPTFRATLEVSENQTVVKINQILKGIGLVAGVFVTYRIGRVWRVRRAPLKGIIGIYKRVGDNPSAALEEVFVESLPHKITYQVPAAHLPQYPLSVDKMVVSTRANRKTSRAGGAWVTIVKDDQELAPRYVESGQLPTTLEDAFHTDSIDNTTYYLIKDKPDNDVN